MKGNNELHLNDETLIEALQEYFNKRYTPTPKVESVRLGENKGYSSTPVFVVTVTEVEATK